MKKFQFMAGKTVKSIEEGAVNCVIIEFTDGEKVEVCAECGSGPFAIPFFVLCNLSLPKPTDN